jgi:hypothetical protein
MPQQNNDCNSQQTTVKIQPNAFVWVAQAQNRIIRNPVNKQENPADRQILQQGNT